ncbi:hypothetical protein AGMMS49944_08180 [Spirochaetia bacterium]|nr:hypothetical protein AGMMS49944_08180 [Spirochaetia bacterium]
MFKGGMGGQYGLGVGMNAYYSGGEGGQDHIVGTNVAGCGYLKIYKTFNFEPVVKLV